MDPSTVYEEVKEEAHYDPKTKKFFNIWSTWSDLNASRLWHYWKTKNFPKPPEEIDKVLPVRHPTKDQLENPPVNCIQVTYIGHASFLIQVQGINILTDPVWSEVCFPVEFLGPRRIRPVPVALKDLPTIHFVLISHDHWDHFDVPTCKELWKLFRPTFLVPKLMTSQVTDLGITEVYDKDWWESYNANGISFIFTPAQHWSGRIIVKDQYKSLWGGWIIKSSVGKVYFVGDTGYCSVFKRIGELHGPFDLSLIPIGAYEPIEVLKYQHISPIEAIQVHKDINSRFSIGMHWGTFILSNEPVMNPQKELSENISKEYFTTIEHGEVIQVVR